MSDFVRPILEVRRLTNQFEVAHKGSDSFMLVAENQSRETSALAHPIPGHCLETDVLRENHTPKLPSTFQKDIVIHFIGTIFLRSEHVHASSPELLGNGQGHVHIHDEWNRHGFLPG
jgi:hypothetical protein